MTHLVRRSFIMFEKAPSHRQSLSFVTVLLFRLSDLCDRHVTLVAAHINDKIYDKAIEAGSARCGLKVSSYSSQQGPLNTTDHSEPLWIVPQWRLSSTHGFLSSINSDNWIYFHHFSCYFWSWQDYLMYAHTEYKNQSDIITVFQANWFGLS